MRGPSRNACRRHAPAFVCLLLVPVLAGALRADEIRARVVIDRQALAARVPGVVAGSSGAPVRDVALVVPRGHRATSVRIENVQAEPWTAAVVPDGARAPVPTAEVIGMGAWCGYQIAHVRLHPLHGVAGAPQLLRSCEVVLETSPGAEMPRMRRRANAALAAREAALVRGAVANPEQVDLLAPPAGTPVAKRGGFRPAAYPDLEGSDVEYVIVTSAALAGAFQTLADWKTRRGVPTLVRTIESIQAAYRNGADVQETIRNFLQDAYTKWSLQWVLLGGDTDVIPARFLSSSFGLTSPEAIPSDLYFAGLDGTWNADGDALWGEAPASVSQPDPDGGDMYAEVYLTRAPVTTVAQVNAFVQKVINYETPVDPTYQANTLFLGEVLFPVNWDTSQVIEMDGGQLSEDIITLRLPPGTPVTRRYEDYPSFAGALPLSRALTLADLQSGCNLVNHIGHGYRYNMSVADQSIVNADADALTNTDRYSVINILNCTSLAFDYSCLGEHFVLNPSGGAAAVVGASRSAYPLPAREYQDDWYDLLFNQGVWRFGELFARSRLNQTPQTTLESAHRWTHYIYNALGEPEMQVHSGLPAALAVTHPAGLDLGPAAVGVTVTSGAVPVEGARVCLAKGEEDYQVGTTGPDGSVSLPFAAESPGDVLVTVSGRGLRTYLGTIAAGAGPAAYVHLQSTSIDDDASGGTSGNGDGTLDAGETVDLRFTLRNDGSAAVGAVAGTATETDAYVTVVAGTFATGALAAGGSAQATGSVRLQLAASAPDRHVFELQLAMVADGSLATQDKLRKEIHAPSLRLVRLEVLDSAQGNGNGEPDEGEIFDLRAWIKNDGSGRVDGLAGVLQTTSPNVTIYQGTSSYGSIASRVESANTVLFQMSEGIITTNLVDLRLTDNRGRLVVRTFELRRPAAPVALALDPSTGPTVVLATWYPNAESDLAGYHVYRALGPSGPWTRATVDYTNRTSYFRDTGVATNTRYYYQIAAVDSSGNESPRSATVAVSTNPPQVTGWPIAMAAETSSSPALGDLDGDGMLEVVQGDARVYAWHGNGIEVLDADSDPQTWGVFNTQTGTTNAAVLLLELDGTAGLEVLSCDWADNKIFALDGDGDVLWTREPATAGPVGTWGTPAAADVDRDGRNEVFVPLKDGRLFAWNHDGTPFLPANPDGYFATTAAYSRSSPALGDLDGDFELEIVLTDVAGKIHAWKPDGALLAGFPKNYGVAFYNSPVLGDVDGDGDLEIIAIHQSGSNNLHCLRGDGTELAGFPKTVVLKSASLSPSPALCDLDADGKLEIVVGSNEYTPSNSKIYVYRWDGTLYPGWPQSTGSDSESSPIVADLDGDGHPDIAFGGQEGVLRGWKRDGTELLGFPLSVGDFIRGTPAVGDVDGDGDIDLVLAGWDRNIYVWDFPAAWNAQLAQWPGYLHDAQRTALYGYEVQDATDAGGEDDLAAPPPAALELLQNRPNPFNPTTEIRFGIPAGGAVARLEVYDVRGRLVRRLLDEVLPAGRHRVLWDGRDVRGGAVPSGMYFYRLRWQGSERARRMLVLK